MKQIQIVQIQIFIIQFVLLLSTVINEFVNVNQVVNPTTVVEESAHFGFGGTQNF